MTACESRKLAEPKVVGREVWELRLGTIHLPKPLTVAAAEMKAWSRMYRGKGVFMRPVQHGQEIIAFEENGRLLTEKQVAKFRELQGMEDGLTALAKGFGGG